MRHDFPLNKFDELKKQAELKYQKVGTAYCPALKVEVVFNSDGFHHLRYDNHRSERDKKVQRNKFMFLDEAIEIIKTSTTIQEYRSGICPVGKADRSGFRKTKIVEWFGFFAITNFDRQIRVKTVIRRVGEGQYHFWSVMPFWKLSETKRVVGSVTLEDE